MIIKSVGKKYFLKVYRRKKMKGHQVYFPVFTGIKRGDKVYVSKVELKYNEFGKIIKFRKVGKSFLKNVGCQRIYFTRPHIKEKDMVLIQKIEVVEKDRIKFIEERQNVDAG